MKKLFGAEPAAEPKVVEAVGTAGAGKKKIGPAVEAAMVEAINQAAKDGITDPEKVRERILEARKTTIDQHRKAEAEALAALNEQPAVKE